MAPMSIGGYIIQYNLFLGLVKEFELVPIYFDWRVSDVKTGI